MGRLHTIARDSGLFYCDEGHTNATHFAGVFLETWQAIPFMDRRAMTQHWRRLKMQWLTAPGYSNGVSAPRVKNWSLAEVKVVDFPPNFHASCAQMLGYYASPRQTGVWPQFIFWDLAVNGMTDRALSSLIARELACAFVAATQEKLPASVVKPNWDLADLEMEDESGCEDTIHDVMANWGFTPALLDDWCQTHFSQIEHAIMAVSA